MVKTLLSHDIIVLIRSRSVYTVVPSWFQSLRNFTLNNIAILHSYTLRLDNVDDGECLLRNCITILISSFFVNHAMQVLNVY